mmetsp:Transcript_10515/g.20865  ORF Transcript_10515/g.20865 Transcript_10515/m.20865 type:complete len:477 (-) Transcript_10515:535-1965(-)
MGRSSRPPKRPKSAYNYFQLHAQKLYADVFNIKHKQAQGISQAIGKWWGLLPEEYRKEYEKLAQNDVVRYAEEHRAYLDSLKAQLNEPRRAPAKRRKKHRQGPNMYCHPSESKIGSFGGGLSASSPSLSSSPMQHAADLKYPKRKNHRYSYPFSRPNGNNGTSYERNNETKCSSKRLKKTCNEVNFIILGKIMARWFKKVTKATAEAAPENDHNNKKSMNNCALKPKKKAVYSNTLRVRVAPTANVTLNNDRMGTHSYHRQHISPRQSSVPAQAQPIRAKQLPPVAPARIAKGTPGNAKGNINKTMMKPTKRPRAALFPASAQTFDASRNTATKRKWFNNQQKSKGGERVSRTNHTLPPISWKIGDIGNDVDNDKVDFFHEFVTTPEFKPPNFMAKRSIVKAETDAEDVRLSQAPFSIEDTLFLQPSENSGGVFDVDDSDHGDSGGGVTLPELILCTNDDKCTCASCSMFTLTGWV